MSKSTKISLMRFGDVMPFTATGTEPMKAPLPFLPFILSFNVVGWATERPSSECWYVGGSALTGALHILESSSCYHCHLHHLLQQNPGWLDILVLAWPGCPGKLAVKVSVVVVVVAI